MQFPPASACSFSAAALPADKPAIAKIRLQNAAQAFRKDFAPAESAGHLKPKSMPMTEFALMPLINGKEIETLFSEEQIARRNAEMAAAIARDRPKNLLVLPILKGSFVFAADIIRALYRANIAPEVEFITVSSYGAGRKSGKTELVQDLKSSLAGRDILLIDDILESGRTLKFVSELLRARQPNSLKIAALLDKPMCRKAEIEADYVGFACPDKFVVGYGMDAAHAFRQLPFIGIIKD